MSDASMGSMSDMSSDDSDLDSELDEEEEDDWEGFEEENESDLERAYENKKRRKDDKPSSTSQLLPIRLADGSVAPHPREPAPAPLPLPKSRVTFDLSEEEDEEVPTPPDETVVAAYAKMGRSDPLGARFGRPAVKDVLAIKDSSTRLNKAREEIASLSRDIIASPELGVRIPLVDFYVSALDPAHSSTCFVVSSRSVHLALLPARRRMTDRPSSSINPFEHSLCFRLSPSSSTSSRAFAWP